MRLSAALRWAGGAMASCFLEVLIETQRFHGDEESCQALKRGPKRRFSKPRCLEMPVIGGLFGHGYPQLPPKPYRP